ncbi:alpha/beta hydrolase family protein [Corynebacterium sp. 153RC1]|uniref:alpha/beta hydrolase family protein n=1 Tax=unclassified Corynebacterium TaxID=2624378 RepID=UPI00211BC738|nr:MULTISPECIES: alpha/beta hydrolase family protein [unclassified Corynebacterium]MCQ9371144.1 alpha/beta hydrolase family protein [Corynebacterium sp. 35RC1]MCQ9352555.1 alpha/beta hydrolase family protein [Corynebacterium sp. 209RC1]MCQ9354739.1 alpha/beta hydrolase family protein [Corynebacterium sp. 1222RC1]MCQ9356850.1 alpha/beta hydrolase family protein [Corynebacterium sp. 122RC1]MCQ9358946.1 alpha/beta hydrolase family protein [Corynebacterium sp. 142RC1]
MIPLSTSALGAAAQVLRLHHSGREQAWGRTAEGLGRAFSLMDGQAAQAARNRSRTLLRHRRELDLLLTQAAIILELTASANAVLEGFAQKIWDLNPGSVAAIAALRALGRQLDAACAAELDRLAGLCRGSGAAVEGEAVIFGELDAQNIITVVAGVGSSSEQGQEAAARRALALHEATGATVIAWQGYTAPASVVAGLRTEPAVAGGRDLAAFQQHLREVAPQAQLTVVGYSYGSVVTGHAGASHGLEADTVVLVGSPGVPSGAFSGSRRVVAVLGARDPIGLTGSRFGALHGEDPHVEGVILSGGHSDYFEDPAFHEVMREVLAR